MKHLVFKIFKRLLFAFNADTVSNKGSVKQERGISLILDEISLIPDEISLMPDEISLILDETSFIPDEISSGIRL